MGGGRNQRPGERRSNDRDHVRQARIHESANAHESYEFSSFRRASSTDASRHTGYSPNERVGHRRPRVRKKEIEAMPGWLFCGIVLKIVNDSSRGYKSQIG